MAARQSVAVDPLPTFEIVDALTVRQLSDATDLVFEYMTATLDEVGWPVPERLSDLPEAWRSEVDDLAASYPPPGMFLVAYRHQRPIGGVGMQVREPGTAEVKHLYVRPDERGGMDAYSWTSSIDGPPKVAYDDSYSTYSRAVLTSSISIDNLGIPMQSPTPMSRCL